MYLYNNQDWPIFRWNSEKLLSLLSHVRNRQGKLLGKMGALGFELRNDANLEILTMEILKSTEIEGEILDKGQVRSSIARRLGLEISGLVYSERNVDGIVDLMIDATKNFNEELTKERLFSWHAALFPTGKSGMYNIITGNWRDDSTGPMQVVSGALGKEKVHYQAPPAVQIENEMRMFLDWFNLEENTDLVLKAAIAHLWFVTIHPFEDGNGRISRALSDMLLARSDEQSFRFYSMSTQIRKERNLYYDILEKSQKGTLDITNWLEWFLNSLLHSIENSEKLLEKIIYKHAFWFKYSNINMNERQRKIINLLMDDFEGVLKTTKWAKICKCSQDTALRDIQDLINKGIMVKKEQGSRSTNYELKTSE
ncbi:MAG: Fic family protein [Bacteroidetes bacterium]|jgi:Fic family protein|nr:Fic family protein [Bacteroidota bacterium]MBK8673430.1 Fic family protein [Bacteroidota bacterium]MBK9352873.1 Fic family protein [Bacteroidota bacterium]MBK9633589.1 Fic family protein [Bacteroidota bacterium]